MAKKIRWIIFFSCTLVGLLVSSVFAFRQFSLTDTRSQTTADSSAIKTRPSRDQKHHQSSTPKEETNSQAALSSSSAISQNETQTGNTAASQSPAESLPALSNPPSGGTHHLLNMPQQIQRAWNTCAPTAVSMMLASRGIEVSQEQLAQEMGTDEDFGTHNADAICILNRHLFGYDTPTSTQAGYRLETVTDASPTSQDMRLFKERLVKNIKDGYPMYYTIDNSVMYPGKSGEHNLIGTGYLTTADDQDIAYIYYIDPSYTQQDPVYGGLKIVTPEELLKAMVPCMEPNYGW